MNGHLEGEQPYLGDLLTIVINHLLTGMLLQAPPFHSLYFCCTGWVGLIANRTFFLESTWWKPWWNLGTLRLLGMSWGVKTTCLEAPGVSLGGSGVSIGGVGSLRIEILVETLLKSWSLLKPEWNLGGETFHRTFWHPKTTDLPHRTIPWKSKTIKIKVPNFEWLQFPTLKNSLWWKPNFFMVFGLLGHRESESSNSTGVIKWDPFWRYQTIKNVGNFQGFPVVKVHCLCGGPGVI